MKKLIAIYCLLFSYSAYSLENLTVLNDKAQLNLSATFTPLNISVKQQAFENNFTFNNQLTLHKSDRFNILVTANITQTTGFEQSSPNSNPTLLNNKVIPPSSEFMPTIHSSFNDTKHQYGLIGSYALTPKWHVSGGLIYAAPSASIDKAQSNINNVALIGTSYSF